MPLTSEPNKKTKNWVKAIDFTKTTLKQDSVVWLFSYLGSNDNNLKTLKPQNLKTSQNNLKTL